MRQAFWRKVTTSALILIGLGFHGASANGGSSDVQRQLMQPAKKAKSGLAHLDSGLNELLALWLVDRTVARDLAASRDLAMMDDLVHVTIQMRDVDLATVAMSEISELGGTVSARFEATIDAWVPITALSTLDRFDGVSMIHQPIPPMPLEIQSEALPTTDSGSSLTQGFAASNADDWNSSGFRGAGVDVALVDSFKDAATAISYGELPDPTYCYPSCASLNVSSRHGTACAEIIHDLAPDASITMSSAGTATEMAQLIVDLAASGHDIISASMAFLDVNPGDGTGIMASAISTAKNTYGTLYVGSAGNNANYHWDGYYSDPESNGYHNFSGEWEVNLLDSSYGYSAGTLIMGYLRWSAWPVTNQDFDLELYYWNGSNWEFVAEAAGAQTGTQPPFEFLAAYAPYSGLYAFAIKKYSATTTPVIDLMAWGRHTLEFRNSSRSLLEPATAPQSCSVAAVDAGSYALESYSSWGPSYGSGGSLSGGYSQPRISGYANVDTWSYGPGVFNGTSSAAPHVAGAAALVRGAYPAYTPAQTQSFLESRAIDRGPTGYDYLYGHGRLWLGSPPCSYSISPTSANPSASGGPGSFSVTATASCPWTASSNSAWISVTSGSSGAGNGSVGYSVGVNSSASPRSGTITAAGKTFTVNQSGAPTCSYSISPTSVSVDAAGEAGSVTVTTTAGCQWSAASNDSWILVTSGSSGTGSGSADYTVLTNESPSQRSGSVTIAGHTFTVNQGGDVNVVFGDGFESSDTTAWSSTAG